MYQHTQQHFAQSVLCIIDGAESCKIKCFYFEAQQGSFTHTRPIDSDFTLMLFLGVFSMCGGVGAMN